MKIEIGGMRSIPGWLSLDNREMDFNIITDELPVDDESVDYLYMSHVIEHIPIVCAESVFKKIFSKLDRKSTRLNSSHVSESRMPSSA